MSKISIFKDQFRKRRSLFLGSKW